MTSGCGTHNAYSNGCRCTDCRQAHRAYESARRKKALASGALTHGLRGTYDAGCRCDACFEARRAAYPRDRATRKPRSRSRSG